MASALVRSPASRRDLRCPVAATAEVIADPWTLLIVREAFGGPQRFDALRAALPIASNILSARLAALVDDGILERAAYQEHPLRYEYALTEKGRDLLPVIRALFRWGERWTEARGRRRAIHEGCGGLVAGDMQCAGCGARVGNGSVRLVPNPS